MVVILAILSVSKQKHLCCVLRWNWALTSEHFTHWKHWMYKNLHSFFLYCWCAATCMYLPVS